MKKLILILALCCACTAYAGPVFQGSDGILIIEAEATDSPLDKWVAKKTVKVFTGESHLEFTGNKPPSGPATSPLKYTFTVDKDGIYHLWIRAHKRLVGDDGVKARNDLCNDCYVRLEGDYDTGGKTPKSQLGKDTKLYVHGESATTFDWTAMLDYHHPETHKATKTAPKYKLKAGEKYTFTVSGRSQRFNFDRILFCHESADVEKAKSAKTPASKVLK